MWPAPPRTAPRNTQVRACVRACDGSMRVRVCVCVCVCAFACVCVRAAVSGPGPRPLFSASDPAPAPTRSHLSACACAGEQVRASTGQLGPSSAQLGPSSVTPGASSATLGASSVQLAGAATTGGPPSLSNLLSNLTRKHRHGHDQGPASDPTHQQAVYTAHRRDKEGWVWLRDGRRVDERGVGREGRREGGSCGEYM